MKKYLLIVLSVVFLANFYHSQILDWTTCGYVSGSGGGTYLNIDGSDIDATVQLEYDGCCGGGNVLFLGINNGGTDAIVHNYAFNFSEQVDVNFRIFQITANGHDDYLLFSGTPNIIPHNVTVNGNEVEQPYWNQEGYIEVSYQSIDSFNIQHGRGVFLNPGYIMFEPIVINSNKLGTEINEKPNITFSQNSDRSSLNIKGKFEPNLEIVIFDYSGKEVEVDYELSDNIEISTNEIQNGMYILMIKSGESIFRQKFMISR